MFDKNKIEKKRAYKEKIKGIIAKEELKAKTKDLNMYGTMAQKKTRKEINTAARRNKLLKLIDEKRLEKYIISMKVDYDEINRSFIESGEAKDIKKQNQKLAGPSRIVKDSAPRFALGFAFVVFINSFIYTATCWMMSHFGFKYSSV